MSEIEHRAHEFEVKVDGKLYQLLADKIYQDKPLAAIREILFNAFDAHLAAGTPDAEILVHLPSYHEPYVSISDNGTGISPEDMVYVYRVKNVSTKDGVGKVEPVATGTVGKMGLGALAPLAVADSCTLVSRHGGKQRTYVIAWGDTGKPVLGVPKVEDTDAANGVQVTWAVRREDVGRYAEALSKVLTYFEPLPTIVNGPETFAPKPRRSGFDGEGYRVSSGTKESWERKYSPKGTARAIMGMIVYPIDPAQIAGLTDLQKAVLDLPIDIDFESNALGFTPGREFLEYGERDNTQKAIKTRVNRIVRDARTRLDAIVGSAESFYEAVQLYQEAGAKAPAIRHLGAVVGVRWRGRDISEGGYALPIEAYPSLRATVVAYADYNPHRTHQQRQISVVRDGVAGTYATKDPRNLDRLFVPAIRELTVFRNDVGTGVGVRFKQAVDNLASGGAVIVIMECDDADFIKLQTELDGVTIRGISEIDRPEPKRYKASVRVLGGSARQDGEITKDTLYPVEIDMDQGGLYVATRMNHVLDAAGGTDVNKWNGDLIAKKLGARYRACIKNDLFSLDDENLVFVPTGLVAQFEKHPKWTLAWEAFETRADAVLDDPETLVRFTKGAQYRSFAWSDIGRTFSTGDWDLVLSRLGGEHAFKAFETLAVDYRANLALFENLGTLIVAFSGRGKVAADDDTDGAGYLIDLGPTLDDRFRAILSRYPLLAPAMNGAPRFRGVYRDNGTFDDQDKERVAYFRSVAEYVMLLDGQEGPQPAKAAPVPAATRSVTPSRRQSFIKGTKDKRPGRARSAG